MKTKEGKIITVMSCKGGVGKTITTLNLAAMYSLQDYKVLVIDLDIYGGAIAAYVNSDCDKTIYNLVDDLSNNRYQDINHYLYNYNDNISILAAPKDPRQANKIESRYLSIILGTAVSHFDIVLIDTCTALNDLNLLTLDTSDSILHIFTNDPFDIKNTASFISIVKDTNVSNYFLLLNESIDFDKNYFSTFEIRTILKHNIDFTLSKSMHIRGIDSFIMEGKILVLNDKLHFVNKNDYEKLKDMANTLYEGRKGDDNNE
jgi:pilus assembly protein CpaE